MSRGAILTIVFCLLLSFCLFSIPSLASAQSPSLMKGVDFYKQESFGEAVKALEAARNEDPQSSTAAFFLGLAYKQLMDYRKAVVHLRDAVTLTPRIKEALVELIEVLYQLYEGGNVEEAKKWIEVAEKEDIYPAKSAFLKGLILAKEGQYQAASEAFEKAKALDSSLSQSADVQIALCHLNEKNLKKARERLQAAILFDPQSDLASFARQYQDLVEKQLEMEKPLRVTLSVFGGYDTNLVLKPMEGALAPDVTNEASRTMTSSIRLDYVPVFEGPWLFNAQYALGSSLNQRFSTSHDSVSNGIYVTPGYNFGKSALNLAVRYNHAMVRGPSYKKYMYSVGAGPLYRHLIAENQILEFFGGLTRNEYYQPPLVPEEDRDSDKRNAYVSWVWLPQKDTFVNLKYDYSNEDADGTNWQNKGHDIALSVTIPLAAKLNLQLSGEVFFQDYRNIHTFFEVQRDDRIYTGIAGFTYELFKHANLVLQYTRTRADSNIAIYDYEKAVYSAGIEYRF